MADRAARLAQDYRFRLTDPEHIIHELLAESGFRSHIRSAAGDPDQCRGGLAHSFREPAQFSFPAESIGPTDLLRELVEQFDRFVAGPGGEDPEALLVELCIRAIRSSDGSMIAPSTIQGCGACSLLLQLEDISFMDEPLGYVCEPLRNDPVDELLVWQEMGQDQAFQPPRPEDNPPLNSLLRRVGPGPVEPDPTAEAQKTTGPQVKKKLSPEQRRDEEVAAEVNACLQNLSDKAPLGDIDTLSGQDVVSSILPRFGQHRVLARR